MMKSALSSNSTTIQKLKKSCLNKAEILWHIDIEFLQSLWQSPRKSPRREAAGEKHQKTCLNSYKACGCPKTSPRREAAGEKHQKTCLKFH
jgi:hypothetical protein